MNAINSAKQGAAQASAYSYMSAIEYYIASTHADDDPANDFALNGTLSKEEANTLLSNLKVKGSQPTGLSDVVLSNGKIVDATILAGGYTVSVDNGEVSSVVEGTAPVTYAITLTGTTGAATLSKATAEVGDTVTLTESADYAIGSIKVNGTSLTYNNGYSFTMPSQNTTVNIDASEIYGVAFNGTTGTRLNKAFGATYIDNAGAITGSFDSKEIYKDIVDVTDTYGNVFVQIPKFYINKSVDASGNFAYKISKYKKDSSYYLPYSFQKDDGTELPYVWIGKYDASLNGTKLESKTGKAPLVSQTISTFRTYARNNGTGYQLLDIHAIDLLQTLFYVEFATLDSQSIMQGFTAATNTAALNSGQTDNVKNGTVTTISGSSTSNSDGKYAMKYRGIENFYGNIFQFIDGINIQNNIAYVNTKPSTYASDVFTGDYKQVGYTNATANGNVTKMGYDSSKPFVQLPTVVGTNTYGDYCWQSTGNRIALFGGDWDDGSRTGASRWSLGFGSGSTILYIGSRLLKKAL